jgi:outer membrane protein assembly factor BamB
MSTDGKESVLYRVPESAWGANRMAVAAAPVLDERRQVAYFVANSGRESQVFAWSMRGDRLLWQRSLATGLVATPAVRGDGAVVVADLAGVVRALAPDGSLLFSYSADCDYLLAGPVSDATHRVFLGDPLGRLHVIDGEGAGKPVFEAERSFQARPSIDRSGQLYLPGADRQVYVF